MPNVFFVNVTGVEFGAPFMVNVRGSGARGEDVSATFPSTSTPRRKWRLCWPRIGEPSRICHSSPKNGVSSLRVVGVNRAAMRIVLPTEGEGGCRGGSQGSVDRPVG